MKDSSSINPASISIGNTQRGHHFWIGKCDNNTDFYAGQTFKIPRSGSLKTISILPELIVGETDATLSVYEFDEQQHAFKDKKTECKLQLHKSDENKWIQFHFNNVHLDNSRSYAFKISCNHNGIMAIAECNWSIKDPYPEGEQWVGSSKNPQGNFHRNFDLAFLAEIGR